jgi:hypothetical protein
MRDDVRRALAITRSSSLEDRTVDITTTGRRSGEPRRIEIVFYRFGDAIYLSGIPAPRTRDWLANLAATRASPSTSSTVWPPICRPWPRSSPIRPSVVVCSWTSSTSSTIATAPRARGEGRPRRVGGGQPAGEGQLPGGGLTRREDAGLLRRRQIHGPVGYANDTDRRCRRRRPPCGRRRRWAAQATGGVGGLRYSPRTQCSGAMSWAASAGPQEWRA